MWRIICTSLVVGLTQAINCPNFECAATSPANQCVWYNNGVYNVKQCPATAPYCPYTTPTVDTVCTSPEKPELNLYPGDFCINYADCMSGICENYRCQGKPLGIMCKNHNECEIGLFCSSNNRCTAQQAQGASCQNDYECMNNMGCNKSYGQSDGICTAYYSVAVGSKVKTCVAGLTESTNKLCVTGVCIPDDPQRNLGGTCAKNAVSNSKNAACNQDSDCTGKRDTDTITGLCRCGFSNGKAYCELFSGDAEPVAALGVLQNHVKSHAINLCHTAQRWSEACIGKSTSYQDLYSYSKNQYFTENSVLLIDNVDCVKNTLNDSYFNLNENAYKCTQYQCNNTTATNCLTYAKTTNAFTASVCSSGQQCDAATAIKDSFYPTTCQAIPKQLAYPGENCNTNTDCVYGMCNSGICTGVPLNHECDPYDPYQCDKGMRCAYDNTSSTYTCQTVLSDNVSGCSSDFDCHTTSGCNISTPGSTGTCVQYFSVPVGSKVSCVGSGLNYLCVSGWCNPTGNGAGTCVEAPNTVQNSFPKQCMSAETCQGVNSLQNYFLSECRCGLNSTGTKYCDPFIGDSVGQQYLKEIKSIILYSADKCQTARRFSEECFKVLTTYANVDVDEFTYNRLSYHAYGLYMNNSECVKTSILYDYWTHYFPGGDQDDDDDYSNTFCGVVGAALAVLA